MHTKTRFRLFDYSLHFIVRFTRDYNIASFRKKIHSFKDFVLSGDSILFAY